MTANETEKTVHVRWEEPIQIHNYPVFQDTNRDARVVSPGTYGSEYIRMLELKDGSWLSVYTFYDNNGYRLEAGGGTKLGFSLSRDQGKTWEQISTLSHPSRDMDNGQLAFAENGDILLSCRSVRWQESYYLPLYRSADGGRTWEFSSMIDETSGHPGALGNPDKGLYEPHLYRLEDGRLAVMYANEKHVKRAPHFSQIISMKVSDDDGETWGDEIWVAWDPERPELRPGMPVWMRLKNGLYMVVFEVGDPSVKPEATFYIYYKTSKNGVDWEPGIGTLIPEQWGGPYLEQLEDGRLLVSSNAGVISVGNEDGTQWKTLDPPAFPSFTWSSLKALEGNRFAIFNSCSREEGGHNIQLRFGELEK
jgi:hypothetical protein